MQDFRDYTNIMTEKDGKKFWSRICEGNDDDVFTGITKTGSV